MMQEDLCQIMLSLIINYSDLLFERPIKSKKQSDNLFDFDSIFSNSSSRKSSSSPSYDDDDIFGGMPGLRSSILLIMTIFCLSPRRRSRVLQLTTC